MRQVIRTTSRGMRFGSPGVESRMSEDQGPEDDALDAYSAIVKRVAETVAPSVASLVVRMHRAHGMGSASVLSADGLLLTSAHVIRDARDAIAQFADGSEAVAQVIGRDPLSDLAVLRAVDAVLPPVPLGDAGQEVVPVPVEFEVAVPRLRPAGW